MDENPRHRHHVTPSSDEGSAGNGAPGPVGAPDPANSGRNGRTAPERMWRAVRLHRLRLVRLPSTPHRIALGVGLGVLFGSIPLIPSQMVLAGVVAWLLRASPTAAVIATLYSNPVTFGPLYAIFFAIGSFLLPDMHVVLPHDMTSLTSLVAMGWDVYLVLCAGGVVFGSVAGVAAYVVTHRMVAAYQQRRVRWRTGARNAPPVVAVCPPSDAGDGCEPGDAVNDCVPADTSCGAGGRDAAGHVMTGRDMAGRDMAGPDMPARGTSGEDAYGQNSPPQDVRR